MKTKNDRRKRKQKIRTSTLFLRNVSSAVKAQFKAWCARRGITMTDKIEDMMRNCIQHEELNKRPGNDKLPRDDG